jgi:hypothetical protein
MDREILKRWLEAKQKYHNAEFHSAKDNGYLHLSTYEMGKRDAFFEVLNLITDEHRMNEAKGIARGIEKGLTV